MDVKSVTAKAEILGREWVEFTLQLQGATVSSVQWKAQGGHKLLQLCTDLAQDLKSKDINSYKVKSDNNSSSQLLLEELVKRLNGSFETSDPEEEICHCRKIRQAVIDQMIVLGAHTPEKVMSFCTAGSGCGTCRPEVQKLIDKRIK